MLPDGTTMRSVFDAFGRTVQSIAAVGLPEQSITSMTYDSRDRVVSQTEAAGTPASVTTNMTYDAGGLTLSVTSPSGKSVAFAYDANGNRTHTIVAPGTAEQTTTINTYDSSNRVVSTTDGEGSTTTMGYDPLGRTLTVTDHLGNTTTYIYDVLGRLLTVKEADNLVVSTYIYDDLDRTTSHKDGKNQIISYQYDALGRQTAYTDAKGATFNFQYDALGRLTRRTEPDATFQTYSYDVAGRPLVHTKADGQTKTHHYDNPHRDFLTRITYSNGEAARVMTHDKLGRLLSATNANSAITRTYDAAGRQLTETQALSSGPTGSFSYQYDMDGNLSRHIRPDGSIVDYAWNARNLLAAVTSDGPPPVANYGYNGRSQISSTNVENGIFTAQRSYDAAGRLTGVTNGTIDTTAYTLSPDGRRTKITRNGAIENYDYDNARQVTSAGYGGLATNQTWEYDPAGNRQTAVTNGTTTSYIANMVNAYTTISGVPAPPLYDTNGNALNYPVRPVGSATIVNGSFTWNINNELISATVGADSAQYQYDALGRRTKRVETIGAVTTTTWFFSNGWNVELEHNGASYVRRHTWGLDLSQSLQGAGGVGGLLMTEDLSIAIPVAYYPTYDGNGNITAWVNDSGAIVASQRYDAFGNVIAQTGTAPSNYGFSTKPLEAVTGLYYYGYRYYDPETGRWLNRDPIEERGGVNLYGFVYNRVISMLDRLGLDPLNGKSKAVSCLTGEPTCVGSPISSHGLKGGEPWDPIEFPKTDVHVRIEYVCKGKEKVREARSAEDLIRALETVSRNGKECCIKLMRFMGHANRQMQFVGRNDWIEAGNFGDGWKLRVYSNFSEKYTFLDIKDKMCEDSLFDLDGCNTARAWPWEDKNEPGINLARDASAALEGVIVKGNRGRSVGLPGTHPNLFGVARYYFNGTHIPSP